MLRPAVDILLLGPGLSSYADAIGQELGFAKTLIGSQLLHLVAAGRILNGSRKSVPGSRFLVARCAAVKEPA